MSDDQKRPRVYVSRPIPEPGLELLRASCDIEVKPTDELVPREELLEKVKGRDALLCLVVSSVFCLTSVLAPICWVLLAVLRCRNVTLF